MENIVNEFPAPPSYYKEFTSEEKFPCPPDIPTVIEVYGGSLQVPIIENNNETIHLIPSQLKQLKNSLLSFFLFNSFFFLFLLNSIDILLFLSLFHSLTFLLTFFLLLNSSLLYFLFLSILFIFLLISFFLAFFY